jgi:L-rhamnose mutarotase
VSFLTYIKKKKKKEKKRKEKRGYNRLYQAKQSSVTHVYSTFIDGKRNTSVLPLSSIIETCSNAETYPVVVTY